MGYRLAVTCLAAVTTACATAAKPGTTLVESGYSDFRNQVAFDYAGCPLDHVRVIRTIQLTTDIDVCGVVRRYRAFWEGNSFGWLDVTSLYPPSALPPPLPPQ